MMKVENKELEQLGTLQRIDIERLEYNNGQLYGVSRNPRYLKDNEHDTLKKSLEDSPELLEYKPLMVYPLENGNYITICGNMRLRIANELIQEGRTNFATIPCFILKEDTPIQKIKEFAIKDNVQAGNWDWDELANGEWETDELQGWGVDCNFLQGDFMEDPLERVDDLKEETYEEPTKEYIECPCCHHRDSKNHFKKVKCLESEVSEENEQGPEDIVYDTTEQNAEE